MSLQLRLMSTIVLASLSLPFSACNKSSQQAESEREKKTVPATTPQIPDDGSPRPSPELAPDEVVRLQIEAIRQTDQDKSGFEIARRFVSPRWSGDAPFAETLRAGEFDLFWDHRNAELGEVQVDGDRAYQIVLLENSSGQFCSFLFVLARQTDDPFQNCWLTCDVKRNLLELNTSSADFGMRVQA